MAQKVRLERCIGGRFHLGARNGGRAAIKGPLPARERAHPGLRAGRKPEATATQRGSSTPCENAFKPPACTSSTGSGRAGPGWGRQTPATAEAARPRPPRNARAAATTRAGGPDAEAGPHDGRDGAGYAAGAQLPHQHGVRDVVSGDISEPRICPPIMTRNENGIVAAGERLDLNHWKRLSAVHCLATQSVLSFMCGLDGRTKLAKYEKFRQPCGRQPAACWEALQSGKLKVGEMEHPLTMNRTRSHMAGVEGCSGNCGLQARTLERKITQALMEVLVEEEWVWWNAEKGQEATASGKAARVLRDGEAVLESGLWVWKPGDEGPILARVGGANLPADGGGAASIN
jgi:hypothetical protein